ncbi:SCO1/SenC-domain-containing protein [Pyronema domesticum]|uniref:Similar to Protein SCO1, mitochondrial acc. no. P23833 n=1 Tax=Pyronema omphalodes (strain CBS 100304) TaxID=1076935 RepID=U4LI24_PYROM|nr:SCO1/SenC-domain-containing protein [Pyronema domesticum]CCX31182.1 Similar to Protein SCO1, mitochondrial; acc. no. P23833 [Pyronema omphalodes CBS 100304]
MNTSSCFRLLRRNIAAAPKRNFTTTPRNNAYKSVEEAKSRYRSGPFSWRAGALFVAAGVGLAFYFQYEKERMARKRITEMSKGVGKPKVGGPLTGLVDHNGKEVDDSAYIGKYRLVYFGFTHCPDICPEELDKMASIIDLVKKQSGNVMTPIFLTCDPARDTPAVMKEYLEEFHPDMVGLTGTYDQIKAICKAYRVYFSTPPNLKPGQDYLVDHSIYFYLMDPEGDFVEALGRQHTPETAANIISTHIKEWKGKPVRTD